MIFETLFLVIISCEKPQITPATGIVVLYWADSILFESNAFRRFVTNSAGRVIMSNERLIMSNEGLKVRVWENKF